MTIEMMHQAQIPFLHSIFAKLIQNHQNNLKSYWTIKSGSNFKKITKFFLSKGKCPMNWIFMTTSKCIKELLILFVDLEDFLKAALINAFGGPAVPISPALPPVGLIGPAIGPPVGPHPPFPPQSPLGIKGGCPLCDRSVYSYCYDKMLHDACCCNNGNFYSNTTHVTTFLRRIAFENTEK